MVITLNFGRNEAGGETPTDCAGVDVKRQAWVAAGEGTGLQGQAGGDPYGKGGISRELGDDGLGAAAD